jgi:hypothetical protein
LSSEVKEWSCTTTLHTCLNDVYTDNFTFIPSNYIASTGQEKVTGRSTCLESNKPSISLFWALFNTNQCRQQMYRLPGIQRRPRNSLLITQSCEIHSSHLPADTTVRFIIYIKFHTKSHNHKTAEKQLLASSCLLARMEQLCSH